MNVIKNGLGVLLGTMVSAHAVAASPEFEIGGVVEVEAAASEDYAGNKSSDIVLATVELAADVTLNDRVSSHLAFLYEEDDTAFGLDEGTLILGLNDSVALTAGRMYVPFGRFDSFMVSDPQTLELGETSETVLMLAMDNGPLYGSAYLFSGDSSEAATVSDELSAGLDVGFVMNEQFGFGASYISNLADSDALQELDNGGGNAGIVDSHVAGASVYVNARFGAVSLLAEHVAALDEFSNGDLDGSVGNTEQPSASNLELGAELGNGFTVAAAYQMTDEAAFIGLPERVLSAAVSYEVLPDVSLAAEYAQMDDYDVADGGTGNDANALTLKLAAEF